MKDIKAEINVNTDMCQNTPAGDLKIYLFIVYLTCF